MAPLGSKGVVVLAGFLAAFVAAVVWPLICPGQEFDAALLAQRTLPPHGGAAAGLLGRPCPACWTPSHLKPAEQQWVIATNKLEVPSMVSHQRRHLTLQLALGALLRDVPGDFVETGVAAGGTAILLLTALAAHDPARGRRLWAADSFQGLPPPVEEDASGELIVGAAGQYAFGEDVFVNNLKKHGVYDEAYVTILKGGL